MRRHIDADTVPRRHHDGTEARAEQFLKPGATPDYRAGVKEGNKGAEAAVAAIEMATLGQEINAALGSSTPTALVRAEAS